MIQKRIVLLFLFPLVFLCCRDIGNPVIAKVTDEILPLKVGNTWKYIVVTHDSTGLENARWIEERLVIGDTVVDGEVWHRTNFSSYLSNRPDGLWIRTPRFRYVGPPDGWNDPQLLVPFPISTGESVLVRGYETYMLLSTNVQVTVPAGTYSCYQYRMTLPKSIGGVEEYILYYASGVGLVKQTWRARREGLVHNYSGDWSLSQVRLY